MDTAKDKSALHYTYVSTNLYKYKWILSLITKVSMDGAEMMQSA